MAKQAFTVLNGPLNGEVYALDLRDGAEVSLRLSDGRVAVYRARIYIPNPGMHEDYWETNYHLNFVGIDPLA